jgi:3-isopropylmalate dehydratase small subunit
MLPITLAQDQIDLLLKDAQADEQKMLEINLPDQVIIRSNGEKIKFEIEEFRKHCLVHGLDDIGLTLQKQELIKRYFSFSFVLNLIFCVDMKR